MLPQLLGEDSGPNQAVPTTLEFVSVLVLVEEVLRLEVVDKVTLVEVEDVSVDVEEVEAWVVLEVAVSVTLVVGEETEVWVEVMVEMLVDVEEVVRWMLKTK